MNNGSTSLVPNNAADGVVVVGAGLAGLFTALKLAPLKVTVISPAPIGEGASSAWAQAGIAAALSEGDTPEDHAADTVRAGAGLVDEAVALLMAREARARIEDLLQYGVPFDKDLEGRLTFGHEAAHRTNRILHVKGDRAGRAIMGAITAAVRKTPSITVLEGVAARDLVVRNGRAQGVVLAPTGEDSQTHTFVLPTRAVVLATGGAGHIYSVTTNPVEARGEGVAIAARAGAVIADAEFVQFHPTAIDIGRDPAPLATEALRGAGALLINRKGERFMRAVHEDAELGPRDVVARAVHREVVGGRGAFLDCRPIGPGIAEEFPTVVSTCRSAGIDPGARTHPRAPAAHYHMGGILVDVQGRSTVDGLWACGEVTSTGAHGANRLASNSLLEAVVFGARVAEDIATALPPLPPQTLQAVARGSVPAQPNARRSGRCARPCRQKWAWSGTRKGSPKRSAPSSRWSATTRATRNLRTARHAKFVAAAAFARTESRGANFRSDYPGPDEAQAHRSMWTLKDADAIAREAAGIASPPRLRIVSQG
ncbi:L-aspartate oxidase [Methyloceanibacter methanicus]|uniref:L-aspartate oxidase n=1 Tax=Methyloceanibacter methanicus TaxID=1774968 RepID=UPI000A4A813B|nr:L-aspartate oxidase [Methyloceanibacter methanicus]